MLVICRTTADGHEVWAAVPRTHIAPGRLVPAMKVGRARWTARSVGRRAASHLRGVVEIAGQLPPRRSCGGKDEAR